ncbi:M14 family metallopeptidase [Spongiimicrobium sp. 3-5]|uniref:M14 family metallopeptidase n=1 Tax=Spongiimicrobium sp. 3-5 TaxID=3332596 RepID=UPI003980932B
MKHFLFALALLLSMSSVAQKLQSPSAFLGYPVGTQFTRHYEVVAYYKHVAETMPSRVQLIEYGQTNERRPLILAYISSEENMRNLEHIRQEHLKSTLGDVNGSKAIVWLSYNVHGNESASTEASMLTLYELLTAKSSYLENTIVIMDPCINPDGRDRYSNWYNQYKNTPYTVDPNSKEHHEGWWSGRSNHYMFDLNRDWAWLTQIESRQRLKKYNQWLPHVHADFHEQGVDDPYFFAPAAEPFHEVITDFQRKFQVTIGKNHARYFDAKGWFYFTKEVYDLFYPSYGDTYPSYNGAIGMTYEQGGSGHAGLAVINNLGDTLTLKDRIAHHYTTGLSTVEVASKNFSELTEEFKNFYKNKNYKYKSYVLYGNTDNMDALTTLLDQHEIQYGATNSSTAKGYHYSRAKNGSYRIPKENLVISTNQSKATLVKVLFEPNAKLSDSITYDITAWSLPFAYGLEAIASESLVSTEAYRKAPAEQIAYSENAYAFISDWNSMKDARFLSRLLQKGIRVRYAKKPFTLDGKSYDSGSLIITKADNAKHQDFLATLKTVSEDHNKSLTIANTGFVDEGKDFGSQYVEMVPNSKVAVLSGEPTSTLRFGEVWHFFEQQLNYPVTVIDSDYIRQVDLSTYDVLILPSGTYGDRFKERYLDKLKVWVNNGGKLIAMGGAIKGITGENGFGLAAKEIEKDSAAQVSIYDQTRREQIKNSITGAIFKTNVDNTHPLAFGYSDTYFSLKLGNSAYAFIDEGTVSYIGDSTEPVAGFAGSEAQKRIKNTTVFAMEQHGKGKLVYMVDNPLFRGFWESGKLFFVNALFMAN